LSSALSVTACPSADARARAHPDPILNPPPIHCISLTNAEQSRPHNPTHQTKNKKQPPPSSAAAASLSAAAAAAAAAAASATDTSGALLLGNVRSSLIRQEDTIIFNLIERAQFARNDAVYQPGAIPVPPLTPPAIGDDNGASRPLPSPSQCSLLEYVLRETERLHGGVRRYTSPDEHAFFPDDLPPLVLPPLDYPSSALHPPAASRINANSRVLQAYLDSVLPALTSQGDDSNYGSAATLDVLCLQALSKRIHYGMFVAEAKFRAAPEQYGALIRARDAEGLMRLLTDEAVERKVVERVTRKAATFGQDIVDGVAAAGAGAGAGAAGAGAAAGAAAAAPSPQLPKFKVPPHALGEMYDKVVMPMTKDVQVEYLLRRLDGVE
jgi:chorismate mutase